jgi:hypothetical protein
VSRQGTGSGAVTSAPTGISCGGSCVADYPEGSVVTLTPQADVGSVFVRWTGACSGSGACSVTMDAARSVSAQFDVRRFRLSITKTPLGLILGSVTSSPAGINCGLLCATASATFPSGTVVTLSPQPIVTASFRGWGGDCTGSGGCVLTMDGDKSVTVDFALLGLIAPQADASPEAGTPTLRSTLGVRGGRGDVALNGNPVLVAREGEGRAALRPLPGDNLVEARLLEGASGGFWQFDLVAGAPLQARALRVVTGELAAIGPDFVTFRLSGRPGERVSFVWTWGRAEK